LINYFTIKKFAELSGYSEEAIRAKIKDGVWMEGRVFRKAPDGRILISAEGFESWVETGLGSVRSQKHHTKSPSPIKGLRAGKGSSSSPPPLTERE
jgi:hypothetical protein